MCNDFIMNSLFTNSIIKSLDLGKTKSLSKVTSNISNSDPPTDPYVIAKKYGDFVFASNDDNNDNNTPNGVVLVDLFDYTPNDYITKKSITIPMVFQLAND